MARRKDHTREELAELAIEAGRTLVAEKGPDALTARNVARAIGYTPGTLYNIFENIDALAAAINIASMQAFADQLRQTQQRCDDTHAKIRGIAQAYLDFHKNEPHLWSLLFAVRVDHHSEAYHDAIHAIFDQVIEAMQPLSKSPTLARRKAKVLWSTLHGICLLQQSGKLNVQENDSTQELVDEFLQQFLQL
jgi:AcrR family transcriptional regulator